MKRINVIAPFTFTFPAGHARAGEKIDFRIGPGEIDDDVADHFFVKAHCGETTLASSSNDEQLRLANEAVIELRNLLHASGDRVAELEDAQQRLIDERNEARNSRDALETNVATLTEQLAAANQKADEATAALTTMGEQLAAAQAASKPAPAKK